MGLEHGLPGSFDSFLDLSISQGGLSFEKNTKTITIRVPAGKSPEGKQHWKTEKRVVPKDVTKSPPPAFPHNNDPKQRPLPGSGIPGS